MHIILLSGMHVSGIYCIPGTSNSSGPVGWMSGMVLIHGPDWAHGPCPAACQIQYLWNVLQDCGTCSRWLRNHTACNTHLKGTRAGTMCSTFHMQCSPGAGTTCNMGPWLAAESTKLKLHLMPGMWGQSTACRMLCVDQLWDPGTVPRARWQGSLGWIQPEAHIFDTCIAIMRQ